MATGGLRFMDLYPYLNPNRMLVTEDAKTSTLFAKHH